MNEQADRTPPPLLKPYGGVGYNFLQRHAVLAVGVCAALLCIPYGFFYAIWTPWLLVPLVVPVVILMLLTIWALPDTSFLPEVALERMFFAFFGALMLWPNYLAVDLPGVPWISLARVIDVPMVLLLAIMVSTSATFRRRMAEILSASPIVWKAVVLFVAIQTVTMPLSSHIGFTLARFIFDQFNNTATFFICCYVFARPGRAQTWAAMFWILAIMVGGLGVAEYHRQRPLWAGHVPQFLLIDDDTVRMILAGSSRATTGAYRASSVFSTPLGLSEFLALGIPFVLHFAASKHYRPWIRIAAGVSLPFLVLVILYTNARLGLFGMFVGVMVYLLYRAIQHWRRNPGALMPMAIMVAYPTIFIAFLGASLVVGRIKAKVWGTGQYEASNQGRMEQLRLGIPKILSHPFGHGGGTAGGVLGYTDPSGRLTIDNYLLAMALDYGFLGLFAFAAMFGVSAYTASRHSFTTREKGAEIDLLIPLGISMIVFLVIKCVFAQDDNHPLAFMMMGILAALAYRANKLEETATSGMPAPARVGPALRPAYGFNQAGAPRRSARPANHPSKA